MKNITDELLRWRGRFPKEVFRLITLFLGGDKTEGDCIHGWKRSRRVDGTPEEK